MQAQLVAVADNMRRKAVQHPAEDVVEAALDDPDRLSNHSSAKSAKSVDYFRGGSEGSRLELSIISDSVTVIHVGVIGLTPSLSDFC